MGASLLIVYVRIKRLYLNMHDLYPAQEDLSGSGDEIWSPLPRTTKYDDQTVTYRVVTDASTPVLTVMMADCRR
jgi:hypothetical protein